MTTSDPVLYPLPFTEAESIRQDAARTRLELAETVEALTARFNVRRQVAGRIGSARRTRSAARAGSAGSAGSAGQIGPAGQRTGRLWVGGAGAAAAVIATGLLRAGAERRRWAAAALAVTAGAVTYIAVDRRRGRVGSDRQDRHGTAIQAASRTGPTIAETPGSGLARPGSARLGDARLGAGRAGQSSRDVVDVLLDQHRQIDGMFAWVRSTDGSERLGAFAALVDFVHRHERAEQAIVHPALSDLDGPAERVVADRLHEENAADRTIASMISRGPDNSRFLTDLDHLHAQVREHAAREETEEFPLLRAHLAADRRRNMANQVRAAQAEPW
jgi:hypothetical protein